MIIKVATFTVSKQSIYTSGYSLSLLWRLSVFALAYIKIENSLNIGEDSDYLDNVTFMN